MPEIFSYEVGLRLRLKFYRYQIHSCIQLVYMIFLLQEEIPRGRIYRIVIQLHEFIIRKFLKINHLSKLKNSINISVAGRFSQSQHSGISIHETRNCELLNIIRVCIHCGQEQQMGLGLLVACGDYWMLQQWTEKS